MNSVAEPGPPRVIVKGMSKSFSVSAVRRISTATSEGIRNGSCTWRSTTQLRARLKLGGLLDLGRNGGQARQQHQRHEGRPLPDVPEDDGDEGVGRIADEVDRVDPEPAEHLVDDPVFLVQHHLRQKAHHRIGRGHRQHQRQPRQRLEQRQAGAVQHQRDGQAERDLHRHRQTNSSAVRPIACQNTGSVSTKM